MDDHVRALQRRRPGLDPQHRLVTGWQREARGGGGPQGSSGSKLSGDRIVLGVLNDQSGVYL
ncbi:hypothetical protein, partial [Asanoa sp. NPDC050611]|uniref:hypothetical protein n=1 Tax=Asanoa sp. NPDC050611 TaxID=3157098 RepID=UPI003405AE8D